ncbi:hypothetical protein [Helicobacter rodentium]|uniref:hypothetical protein n=1 Tax=Helicobacter rodentium TaxID=59617 RepID=UPI002352B96C|nr:hypothetical protein [Helicobacter rodentium]
MTKQSIIKHRENFTMEALRMRFRIIDCRENFSNFLAMTKSKLPHHCISHFCHCEE